MNAQELYEAMKEALIFFRISFHQMDEVSVAVRSGDILEFAHNGRSVTVRLPAAEQRHPDEFA